jgi:hypothetical protein
MSFDGDLPSRLLYVTVNRRRRPNCSSVLFCLARSTALSLISLPGVHHTPSSSLSDETSTAVLSSMSIAKPCGLAKLSVFPPKEIPSPRTAVVSIRARWCAYGEEACELKSVSSYGFDCVIYTSKLSMNDSTSLSQTICRYWFVLCVSVRACCVHRLVASHSRGSWSDKQSSRYSPPSSWQWSRSETS